MKKKQQVMHGKSRHPLYFVWKNMVRRCCDPTINRYERYGGRGISVCSEWLDVNRFIEWAESAGWTEGLQIDRINNDGDYAPHNCRFVTAKENVRTRSTTKLNAEIVAKIKTMLSEGVRQSDVARLFDISPVTVTNIAQGTRWGDVCPC